MLNDVIRHNPRNVGIASNFIAFNNENNCRNCAKCVERCSFKAREMKEGVILFHSELCVGCGLCVSCCKNGAISMMRRET